MRKALVDRGGGGLAGANLFANALEDEDVGVNAHADGEDDAGDAGEGQGGAGKAHKAEQDEQVQQQGQIGVDARAAIVEEHEGHDGEHADNRGEHPLADRVSAERGADGALLQVVD